MSDVCKKCGGTGVKIDHEALQMKRKRVGKHLYRIAITMGVTPSYLSDLENGRRDWNADLLQRFEKALVKR